MRMRTSSSTTRSMGLYVEVITKAIIVLSLPLHMHKRSFLQRNEPQCLSGVQLEFHISQSAPQDDGWSAIVDSLKWGRTRSCRTNRVFWRISQHSLWCNARTKIFSFHKSDFCFQLKNCSVFSGSLSDLLTFQYKFRMRLRGRHQKCSTK